MTRLAVILTLVSSCAALSNMTPGSTKSGDVEQRVRELEARKPDIEALLAEDTDDFNAMLKDCSLAIGKVQQSKLSDAEKYSLIDRVKAFRRSYALAASRATVSSDANVAFWVLLHQLDSETRVGDVGAEMIAAARQAATARGPQRQEAFERYGSYRADGVGGNCVASTAEFESESTANPGLTYHATGSAPIHIRCLAADTLSSLSGEQAKITIAAELNEYNALVQEIGAIERFPSDARHADAVLQFPGPDLEDAELMLLSLRMYLWWIDGYEHTGRTIRPIWRKRRLASSTILWERSR